MRDRLLRLTSLANPRVRHAQRLRDSSRYRREERSTIVDGLREVLRARAGGMQPTCLFVTPEFLDRITSGEIESAQHEPLRELLADPSWLQATALTEPAVFEKIAFGNRDEGIIATIRTPSTLLKDLQVRGTGPLIILDQVEKPGNVGAILRTADAAGASGVILSDPRTDVFNPTAIRASLGTIFAVPLGSGTASETLQWLLGTGRKLFTLCPTAHLTPWQADLRQPTAFVFGSEALGLSSVWESSSLQGLGLPMCGLADSLNVAATTAAILYESLRQRTV